MKRMRNLLRAALRSILRNRMRSLLTSLGIIIGVGAVIVMVGVGTGAQADVEKGISALGSNIILVFAGASRHGGASGGAGSLNKLTLDDVEAIEKQAALITGVSPLVMVRAQIVGGTGNWSTTVQGVSTPYLDIRAWEMESGEFFTDRDVRVKSKVAVLGQTVVDELFPHEDPIGQRIRIRSTPFVVIGVLEKKGGSVMGRDQDDTVIVPSTTALYRLLGGQYIGMIQMSAVSIDENEAAINEVTEILRNEHRLSRGEDNDFQIQSQAEIMEMVTATTKVMTLLLGAVAAVSLIVGGIGIMNIMLVSVTERTREIGIRLAVGAQSRDILVQFLTESVVLSLTGGTVGVVLAYTCATVLNHVIGMTTVVSPGIVLLAFGFAAAIGVFFGYYPARKAAFLNPIDALRYE